MQIERTNNMKKKITAIICATLAASMLFGACSKSETSKNSSEDTSKVEVSLESIHTAVKGAYGENYIPSMEFDAETVSDKFGVKAEWYDEIIAEGPMISAHVDTFIAVKAKSDNVKDVEKALTAYREVLVADTFQYPSNIPKIQASKVITKGDYVFFVMLGVIPMEVEEKGEEAILSAYQTEVAKAIDAIEAIIK